jgi:DNA-binding NtrC family response regulator
VRDEDEIIGADPALLAALALARRVAPTRLPVLVGGESGTGKELVARLIHRLGPAPRGPLVAVNCGTVPRELADSELFGHERGAFTGAGSRKRGWFEEAHGGTLVLDEIGELPLELQPKLLRVLETGRLRRVGGSGEVSVDVRVVALTLRELHREVEQRRFRLDLYHRLAGVEVTLPPLRHRRADIPLLVARFLARLGDEGGPRTMEPSAVEALQSQDWPGNVRELRNVVRRAFVLGSGAIGVGELGLPQADRPAGVAPLVPAAAAPAADPPRLADGDPAVCWPGGPPRERRAEETDALADHLCLTGRSFESIERAVLMWALARNGGSRRRAARSLAVPRSTFCDKVRRYGVG